MEQDKNIQVVISFAWRELVRQLVEDCTCEFKDCPIHERAREILKQTESKSLPSQDNARH